MRIVRPAEPEPQRLDPRAFEADLRGEIDAGLLEVDQGVGHRRIGIEGEACGQAVAAFRMADRQAEMRVVKHEGRAARDVPGLRGAVRQHAPQLGERADIRIGRGLRGGALLRRQHEAADVQIAGVEPMPVKVPGEPAPAPVERRAEHHFVGRRTIAR